MICLNMIRTKCGQLVHVAISRFNAHGRSSLFTWKRALYEPTATGSPSIRAPATSTATVPRIKREYSGHTKYDSAFSQWKILTRPCDWEEDRAKGKGAKRYRRETLPYSSPCPMLYELAAAISLPGRVPQDPLFAILYVGRSYNVRKRLQGYGRDGAHLRNNRPPLIPDMLSRGVSIAFRVAPMKSKKEAEETELELQREFDYAWKKRNNGPRRPQDIHKILHYLDYLQFAYEIKTCDPDADLDSNDVN